MSEQQQPLSEKAKAAARALVAAWDAGKIKAYFEIVDGSVLGGGSLGHIPSLGVTDPNVLPEIDLIRELAKHKIVRVQSGFTSRRSKKWSIFLGQPLRDAVATDFSGQVAAPAPTNEPKAPAAPVLPTPQLDKLLEDEPEKTYKPDLSQAKKPDEKGSSPPGKTD